jgi:hypothetical protein
MIDGPEESQSPLLPAFPLLTFQRVEQTFWTLFVVLPIFTGLLAYNWLPNESFNEEKHEMISSHEVCEGEENQHCGEMADEWKDKRTGEIYTREDFAWHRRAERFRLLYTDFGYGLVGCFFFGYARSREKDGVFFEAFGKAVCINIAVSLFLYLSILYNGA